MTHAFKDVMLALAECGKMELSEAERQVLREVQYQLSGYKAEAVRRPIRTVNYVRFVVSLMCRITGQDVKTIFGGAGWKALRDSVAIRNRVTHPKS